MALVEEFEKYRIKILAMQEIRWPEQGKVSRKGHILYYSGSKKKHEFGTGFVVHRTLKDRILSVTPVNERLCKLRIKGRFQNITLFSVHAPTLDKDNMVKETFYAELEKEFDNVPKYDIKIILGDFNAKLGKEAFLRPAVGSHSLHDTCNDNGQRLADFDVTRGLIVSSTYFPHKDIHKGTWRSPVGLTLNQIDHVLVSHRHASSILDCRRKIGIQKFKRNGFYPEVEP
uniref:Endonuclease/exonuclease/phosphatase domain-containing protein n=1 Tax=Phlebotomus papatasi TaxID=29031 RepID=A0A1B0D0H1_PHLPP